LKALLSAAPSLKGHVMLPRRLLLCALLLCPVFAHADWRDLLNKITRGGEDAVTAENASAALGLSEEDIVAGLKDALNTATALAVDLLGKEGGFMDNPEVRIPLPDELDWVEKSLRKVGQDKLADDFVLSMNNAAEQAVPVALGQFRGAINAMTLDDAKGILNGPDDAATQYFRKYAEEGLREEFLPIVKEATDSTGVTSAYKNMTKYAGSFGSFFEQQSVDVDAYVTDKALAGLFKVVAEEEARIREDPVARSTDLLKKVFGAED
jgi:hypothetical protein